MPDRTQPPELPDYSWCSELPSAAGVAPGPWQDGLTAVPADPGIADLPDAPAGVATDLAPIIDPRIRVLSSYWHAGWPHSRPDALLRPEAGERLSRAAARLPGGFGLAVWDAWRDPRLQAVLHDTAYTDPTLAPGFVAYPDADPAKAPPHATGGTVDLTLTWRNRPLSLGTGFDAFVPEAAAAALEPDGSPLDRDLRRLLTSAMSGAGFVGHPQEWWHWEFGTRYWAAVTGSAVRFGHARP